MYALEGVDRLGQPGGTEPTGFPSQELKDLVDCVRVAQVKRQSVRPECAVVVPENSNLKAEFTDEDDEKFNEELFEQLAEDSLAREEELSKSSEAGESPAPEVEAEPVAKAKAKEPEGADKPKVEAADDRDYSAMSLEEKAYYSLLDSGALDDKGSDA